MEGAAMNKLDGLDLDALSRVFQSRAPVDSKEAFQGDELDPDSIWRLTDPNANVDSAEFQEVVRRMIASPKLAEEWRIAKAFHDNQASLLEEGVLDQLHQAVLKELTSLSTESKSLAGVSKLEQGGFSQTQQNNQRPSERLDPSREASPRPKSPRFLLISALACAAVALLIWWGENREAPGQGSEHFRGKDSTTLASSSDGYVFDGAEFRWPSVPEAQSYELTVDDANSLETIIRVTIGNKLSHRLTEAERVRIGNRDFHWQVRARLKHGETKLSEPIFVEHRQ